MDQNVVDVAYFCGVYLLALPSWTVENCSKICVAIVSVSARLRVLLLATCIVRCPLRDGDEDSSEFLSVYCGAAGRIDRIMKDANLTVIALSCAIRRLDSIDSAPCTEH